MPTYVSNDLDERDRKIIRLMADCNLRVSEVAVRVPMHRNSVEYAITRIEAKTGLNPKLFYDLVMLLGIIGKEREHNESQ